MEERPAERVTMQELLALCRPCSVVLERISAETITEWTGQRTDVKDGSLGSDDNSEGEENWSQDSDSIHVINLSDIEDPDSYFERLTITESPSDTDSSTKQRPFSIFTLEDFATAQEAIVSYYKQLKYAPIKCVECDEATLETKEMIKHFLKCHPGHRKVRFRNKFVPAKERWVQSFVKYQVKCCQGKEDPLPKMIVHKYCPVCNHFDWRNDSVQEPQQNLQYAVILDKNHINKHLRYEPFLCMLCKETDHRYSLSMLNKKAKSHLTTVHKVSKVGPLDLKEHFKPCYLIPELENFLRDYVTIIEENTKTVASPVKGKGKERKSSSKPPYEPSEKLEQEVVAKDPDPLSAPETRKTKNFKTPKPTPQSRKSPATSTRESRRKEKRSFTPSPSASIAPPIPTSPPEAYTSEMDSNLFCIFCHLKSFKSFLDLWDHYAFHLEYTPIVCALCDRRFNGVVSFQYHGIDHPDYPHLKIIRDCDLIVEDWGEDFLSALKSEQDADPLFAAFCPVCQCLFPQPSILPSVSLAEIERHVFRHLKYAPYQCSECLGSSSTHESKFYELETEANEHLTIAHNITPDSDSLKKYFTRCRAIPGLDKLLHKHFNTIKLLTIDSGQTLRSIETVMVKSPHDLDAEDVAFMNVEQILSVLDDGVDSPLCGESGNPSNILNAND